MMGETYLWTNGKGICWNLNSGHYAEINFQPVGFWSRSSLISGEVYDKEG